MRAFRRYPDLTAERETDRRRNVLRFCDARRLVMFCSLASSLAFAESPTTTATADSTIQWTKRGGGSGRPMIFLPALGFPGDCWSRVYATYEKDHPIYVVTFSGAPGATPCTAGCLERMVRDVHQLIRSEGLREPVLVGHLLGAHVALRVAGDYPDSIAGAFCIPLVSPRSPLNQRAAAGKSVTQYYQSESPEMWQALLRTEAARAVQDSKLADEIVESLKHVDRATYSEVIGELVADPIEASLSKIKVPIALMVPVTLPRESTEPELRTMKPSEHARVWVERVRSIFGGIAKCDSMSLRNARMFPIYEHAPQVIAAIDRFLKKLDDPTAKWGNTMDFAAGADAGRGGWKKPVPAGGP